MRTWLEGLHGSHNGETQALWATPLTKDRLHGLPRHSNERGRNFMAYLVIESSEEETSWPT